MVNPKLKIKSDGKYTHVYLNETEIPNITKLKLKQEVGELLNLDLTLTCVDIEVEGYANITINEDKNVNILAMEDKNASNK